MSAMAFFDLVLVRKRWRRRYNNFTVTKVNPFGSYAWIIDVQNRPVLGDLLDARKEWNDDYCLSRIGKTQ